MVTSGTNSHRLHLPSLLVDSVRQYRSIVVRSTLVSLQFEIIVLNHSKSTDCYRSGATFSLQSIKSIIVAINPVVMAMLVSSPRGIRIGFLFVLRVGVCHSLSPPILV